jgi:hypothetical protein
MKKFLLSFLLILMMVVPVFSQTTNTNIINNIPSDYYNYIDSVTYIGITRTWSYNDLINKKKSSLTPVGVKDVFTNIDYIDYIKRAVIDTIYDTLNNVMSIEYDTIIRHPDFYSEKNMNVFSESNVINLPDDGGKIYQLTLLDKNFITELNFDKIRLADGSLFSVYDDSLKFCVPLISISDDSVIFKNILNSNVLTIEIFVPFENRNITQEVVLKSIMVSSERYDPTQYIFDPFIQVDKYYHSNEMRSVGETYINLFDQKVDYSKQYTNFFLDKPWAYYPYTPVGKMTRLWEQNVYVFNKDIFTWSLQIYKGGTTSYDWLPSNLRIGQSSEQILGNMISYWGDNITRNSLDYDIHTESQTMDESYITQNPLANLFGLARSLTASITVVVVSDDGFWGSKRRSTYPGVIIENDGEQYVLCENYMKDFSDINVIDNVFLSRENLSQEMADAGLVTGAFGEDFDKSRLEPNTELDDVIIPYPTSSTHVIDLGSMILLKDLDYIYTEATCAVTMPSGNKKYSFHFYNDLLANDEFSLIYSSGTFPNTPSLLTQPVIRNINTIVQKTVPTIYELNIINGRLGFDVFSPPRFFNLFECFSFNYNNQKTNNVYIKLVGGQSFLNPDGSHNTTPAWTVWNPTTNTFDNYVNWPVVVPKTPIPFKWSSFYKNRYTYPIRRNNDNSNEQTELYNKTYSNYRDWVENYDYNLTGIAATEAMDRPRGPLFDFNGNLIGFGDKLFWGDNLSPSPEGIKFFEALDYFNWRTKDDIDGTTSPQFLSFANKFYSPLNGDNDPQNPRDLLLNPENFQDLEDLIPGVGTDIIGDPLNLGTYNDELLTKPSPYMNLNDPLIVSYNESDFFGKPVSLDDNKNGGLKNSTYYYDRERTKKNYENHIYESNIPGKDIPLLSSPTVEHNLYTVPTSPTELDNSLSYFNFIKYNPNGEDITIPILPTSKSISTPDGVVGGFEFQVPTTDYFDEKSIYGFLPTSSEYKKQFSYYLDNDKYSLKKSNELYWNLELSFNNGNIRYSKWPIIPGNPTVRRYDDNGWKNVFIYQEDLYNSDYTKEYRMKTPLNTFMMKVDNRYTQEITDYRIEPLYQYPLDKRETYSYNVIQTYNRHKDNPSQEYRAGIFYNGAYNMDNNTYTQDFLFPFINWEVVDHHYFSMFNVNLHYLNHNLYEINDDINNIDSYKLDQSITIRNRTGGNVDYQARRPQPLSEKYVTNTETFSYFIPSIKRQNGIIGDFKYGQLGNAIDESTNEYFYHKIELEAKTSDGINTLTKIEDAHTNKPILVKRDQNQNTWAMDESLVSVFMENRKQGFTPENAKFHKDDFTELLSNDLYKSNFSKIKLIIQNPVETEITNKQLLFLYGDEGEMDGKVFYILNTGENSKTITNEIINRSYFHLNTLILNNVTLNKGLILANNAVVINGTSTITGGIIMAKNETFTDVRGEHTTTILFGGENWITNSTNTKEYWFNLNYDLSDYLNVNEDEYINLKLNLSSQFATTNLNNSAIIEYRKNRMDEWTHWHTLHFNQNMETLPVEFNYTTDETFDIKITLISQYNSSFNVTISPNTQLLNGIRPLIIGTPSSHTISIP